MSGARCAERASEAGARGRINKIAGVLITAIPFGSAARRCSWENGIFCYQMPVRIEVVCAENLLFEDSRRGFPRRRRSETDFTGTLNATLFYSLRVDTLHVCDSTKTGCRVSRNQVRSTSCFTSFECGRKVVTRNRRSPAHVSRSCF